MQITAYDLAQRFVGLKEVPGAVANPTIAAMLSLDQASPIQSDEVPWCSAFVNYVAWLLRLPRSKSLAARSWLAVGTPISTMDVAQAKAAYDVCIFKRGTGPQPGPEVLDAPGHVAFFAGWGGESGLHVLGGNQGNAVTVATMPYANLLGIRRLHTD